MTNGTDNEMMQQILDQLKNGNTKYTMILQGITLGLLILKPVFMYYIQAKYQAPPPHESIMRGMNDNYDSSTSDNCDNKRKKDKNRNKHGKDMSNNGVKTYQCEYP